MKVRIIIDIYDEGADPSDDTGVTEETYVELMDFLQQHGSDIEITMEP